MIVCDHESWKVNALKRKAHHMDSELSRIPCSDWAGERGGRVIWVGQCSDTAAHAVAVSRGNNRPAVPCACLTRLVCSYVWLVVVSCSSQVRCKTSVSDVTWREIEFSPIFFTICNAIIFISRAFLSKSTSQVVYPLPIQLSMDLCI